MTYLPVQLLLPCYLWKRRSHPAHTLTIRYRKAMPSERGKRIPERSAFVLLPNLGPSGSGVLPLLRSGRLVSSAEFVSKIGGTYPNALTVAFHFSVYALSPALRELKETSEIARSKPLAVFTALTLLIRRPAFSFYGRAFLPFTRGNASEFIPAQ